MIFVQFENFTHVAFGVRNLFQHDVRNRLEVVRIRIAGCVEFNRLVAQTYHLWPLSMRGMQLGKVKIWRDILFVGGDCVGERCFCLSIQASCALFTSSQVEGRGIPRKQLDSFGQVLIGICEFFLSEVISPLVIFFARALGRLQGRRTDAGSHTCADTVQGNGAKRDRQTEVAAGQRN